DKASRCLYLERGSIWREAPRYITTSGCCGAIAAEKASLSKPAALGPSAPLLPPPRRTAQRRCSGLRRARGQPCDSNSRACPDVGGRNQPRPELLKRGWLGASCL